MPATLLEQFEADANARLKLPPGRLPTDELPRFKGFLKVESHRIKLRHRAGASGRETCRARAQLVDVLIRHLWEAAKAGLSIQARKEFPRMSLVALGGYGRGELSPQSDLDIMFLHQGQVVVGAKPLPSLAKVMEGILTPLWDLGFKIGHSVRTVAECVELANSKTDRKSMETKTSLIEARWIVGDPGLFERLEKAILTRCVEGHEEEYITQRLKDQAERRAKFGDSPTMQEPNIKNGCGGLRDYQNIHWMAFFKYRVRSLAEMEKREFINASERKKLEAAYDLLLAARNELHYQVNRPVDVLAKSIQPTVANYLGYVDRSPSRRLECFMRDLYTHLRNIYLITRTLEERLALQPKPKRLPAIAHLLRVPFRKPVEQPSLDGFRFVEGQILQTTNRVFKEQKRRLMRVFLHAQQRGLKLHPDLAQLIRGELSLVNREFLCDEHVRETFLEILNQRGNVAPVLRAMHEVGLLGKYLPEFGRLTCLVQHEFYHQYAADEHTLQCLAQLDRIWEAQQTPLDQYSALLQQVERPFVLYLALLLHDAGKAMNTGNHSEIGAELAVRVARRLHLDGATAHSLCILIEHHLTMTQLSQRRDLDDPAVIRHFAAQIQNPENLRMLTLHTFADAQATSDKLWNGFKDSLHWQLHHQTMKLLLGGTDFIRAEEKQRQLLSEEVGSLMPRSFGREELDAHFETLPPHYFEIHQAKEILVDLALAHRFMHQQVGTEDGALAPIIQWHNAPDRGYSTAKICTWDRAGLFSTLAGSFSAAGVNILGARVFTRRDGIVIDTFFVNDAHSGSLVNRGERETFETVIMQALMAQTPEEKPNFPVLIARQRIARPLYQSLEGERIATRIYFDNDSSDTRTVIEIETEDRLGLLYAISEVLTDLQLDISLAKIATEKGAAIDTFYIAELDGQKVTAPDRQKAIAAKLLTTLSKLG